MVRSSPISISPSAFIDRSQTKHTFFLRILALVLGILSVLIGSLALAGIPGVIQMGTIGSSVLIGVGATFILGSLSIKWPKRSKKLDGEPKKTNDIEIKDAPKVGGLIILDGNDIDTRFNQLKIKLFVAKSKLKRIKDSKPKLQALAANAMIINAEGSVVKDQAELKASYEQRKNEFEEKNKPFNNRCGEAERLLNLVSNIVNIHKNLTPNKEELDSLEKHLNRASGILDKLEQELNDGDVDS